MSDPEKQRKTITASGKLSGYALDLLSYLEQDRSIRKENSSYLVETLTSVIKNGDSIERCNPNTVSALLALLRAIKHMFLGNETVPENYYRAILDDIHTAMIMIADINDDTSLHKSGDKTQPVDRSGVSGRTNASKITQDRETRAQDTLRVIEDIENTANNIQSRMQHVLEESEQVLETVKSNSTATSGLFIAQKYAEYAEKLESSSRRYDIAAMVFAITGVVIAAASLATVGGDSVSLSISKLVIVAGAFTVSGFLFRRGTFKLKEAKASRRTELTLCQYEPFIARLDETSQKEIVSKIADRIFIRGDMDHSEERLADLVGRKGVDLPALVELLKLVNEKNS